MESVKLEQLQIKYMMKMVTSIIFILLFFTSCNFDNKKKVNLEKKSNIYIDSLQILSFEWKKDSLGCYKIRSINLFDRLLEGYSLNKKSEFLKIFGMPNEQENYEDGIILIYYVNSICYKNKIVENSDKSSIRIFFDSQNKYKKYETRVE